MASINMNGDQSFLCNSIKRHVKNGGNVSHILNVRVSRQCDNEISAKIRQEIFKAIQGIPITKMLKGMNVTITWRSSSTDSAYYHADVKGMLGDIAVKLHTELLFQDILNEINGKFQNIFAPGENGLAFLISRPLVRQIALL